MYTEKAELAKKAAEDEAFATIDGLVATMEDSAVVQLQFGTSYPLYLQRLDFEGLQRQGWLSGQIIALHAQMSMGALADHESKKRKRSTNVQGRSVYVAAVTLYVDDISDAALEHRVNDLQPGDSYFRHSIIVAPLHMGGNHWALAVVDTQAKTVTVLNSMLQPAGDEKTRYPHDGSLLQTPTNRSHALEGVIRNSCNKNEALSLTDCKYDREYPLVLSAPQRNTGGQDGKRVLQVKWSYRKSGRFRMAFHNRQLDKMAYRGHPLGIRPGRLPIQE
ncbi:hypothetical protein V8E36_000635 [Tilletia maclaganii]